MSDTALPSPAAPQEPLPDGLPQDAAWLQGTWNFMAALWLGASDKPQGHSDISALCLAHSRSCSSFRGAAL